MEQRQLEYFQTLYNVKNITQAAQELYLTRQTLSLSMRKLEQELGTTLFIRSKAGLIPTEAAQILRQYIDEQQQLWERTRQKLHTVSTEKVYRLALHILYLSSDAIRRYVTYKHPTLGYRFSIVNITDSGSCQSLLENGTVDIAITHKPPHTARLFWKKVYDSEAYLILRENDALAKKDVIDFETELAGKNILFLSKETMQEVKPMIQAQGGFCQFVESDRVLLQQNLMTDQGCIVVPGASLDSFLQDGLTAKKLLHFPVVNGSYIIYKEDTPELRQVVDTVRSFITA